MSNFLSTPSFITSRQCLIFWVFVAGEFDRQWCYCIDIYSLAVFCTQYHSTTLYCNDSNVGIPFTFVCDTM